MLFHTHFHFWEEEEEDEEDEEEEKVDTQNHIVNLAGDFNVPNFDLERALSLKTLINIPN
jgi:CO dehydrogenase/acetyl-CoA synthase beta subunit